MTDVLVYWRPDLLDDQAPDTGSLEGDFDAIVERVLRSDNELLSNDLVLRVALEAAHDPHLTSAFDELMVCKGRRMVTTILNQAVQRGELPPQDWSLIADTLTAMSLLRVVSGIKVDSAYFRQVIDTLVLPAIRATNPQTPAPSTHSPSRRRSRKKPTQCA